MSSSLNSKRSIYRFRRSLLNSERISLKYEKSSRRPIRSSDSGMNVLSIDLGSSSLKFAAFDFGAVDERRILEGGIDHLTAPDAALAIRDDRDAAEREFHRPLDGASPIAAVLGALHDLGVQIDAVGHRLVYGGLAHETPARVTPELLSELTALVPFDPLHLPAALAAIREIETASPRLAQVVCFDTAFHRRMPASRSACRCRGSCGPRACADTDSTASRTNRSFTNLVPRARAAG